MDRNASIDKQSVYELTVFRKFASVCHLPIIIQSIEKRNHPEPDIRCDVKGGGTLLFELTQLIDNDFANMVSKQIRIKEELHKYLDFKLSADSRKKFIHQYSDAIIFVPFERSLSLEKRKNLFPAIFEHLLRLNEKFEGDTFCHEPIFYQKLRRMTINRGINGPIFDEVPVSTIGDPTVIKIKAKFEKTYQVDYPLHLLTFIDLNPMFPDRIWIPKAKEFIEQNIKKTQFEKLWIFDLPNKNIKFCHP